MYTQEQTRYHVFSGVLAVSSAVAATGIVLTVLGHVLDRPVEAENSISSFIQPTFLVSPTFSGGVVIISF